MCLQHLGPAHARRARLFARLPGPRRRLDRRRRYRGRSGLGRFRRHRQRLRRLIGFATVSPRSHGARLLGGRELLVGPWFNRSRASFRSASSRDDSPHNASTSNAEVLVIDLAQAVITQVQLVKTTLLCAIAYRLSRDVPGNFYRAPPDRRPDPLGQSTGRSRHPR